MMEPLDQTVFAGMKFGNALFFVCWCRAHIACDECDRLGAMLLRDKTFVCQTCLERTNSG